MLLDTCLLPPLAELPKRAKYRERFDVRLFILSRTDQALKVCRTDLRVTTWVPLRMVAILKEGEGIEAPAVLRVEAWLLNRIRAELAPIEAL